jgi:hypothetical protein
MRGKTKNSVMRNKNDITKKNGLGFRVQGLGFRVSGEDLGLSFVAMSLWHFCVFVRKGALLGFRV